MAGGRIGEAWYELGVRDQALRQGVDRAEDRLRAAGRSGEQAFGVPVQRSMDDTGRAGTRLGGVMGKLSGDTGRFGGVMRNLGQGVLQGVGIAGFMGVTMAATALVGGIGSSITAASNLQETISKTNVVFEQAAPNVLKWGENSATAFGLSKNSALGAAATYGNLFSALGLAETKSADMSMSLVELAGDLASFNNVDPTVALDALRSGLVGEAEPLRQFGVSINEARIQQEALKLGLIATTKDALTPAMKAQAIYSIVMADTAKAQGDFARTSGGLANQQRIAAARMEDSLARLGSAILPIASVVIPALANGIASVVDGIAGIIGAIGKWLDENRIVADMIGAIAGLLTNVLGVALDGVGDAFQIVGSIVGGVFSGIVGIVQGVVSTVIGAIRNLIGIAAEIPGPWQDAARDMKASLGDMQASVDAWGKTTVETASSTGSAVPPAVAGPIRDGAGTVGDAATAGITDPIAAAATDGKLKAAEQARLTPHEMARQLREASFSVDDAMKSITEAQETELSRTKEIAALEGFLTGDALKKALRDSRPAVRAEAEAWKTEAEDRLFALRNEVGPIALRTGRNYADVLEQQKRVVGQAAAFALRDAETTFKAMPGKAGTAGRATGGSWGSGIEGSKSTITTKASGAAEAARTQLTKYIGSAVAWGGSVGSAWARGIATKRSFLIDMIQTFLGPVVNFLKGSSPPVAGPLREIDKWGETLGVTFAGGLLRARPSLGTAVEGFLSGADWQPRPFELPGIGTGATGRLRVAPAFSGGFARSTPVVFEGGIHVTVTTGSTERSVIARSIGEAIADEIRISVARLS